MTYPPQQPGPGGTQPPYGQPQQFAYGGQPQQPPYSQPQQFAPAHQYGQQMPPNPLQQGQFPPPYGPPPKKSPLPWVIGGGVVVVAVAVVGVLLWVFLGSGSGSGSSSGDEAAIKKLGQDYVDRAAAADFSGAADLVCTDSPSHNALKDMGKYLPSFGTSAKPSAIKVDVTDIVVDGDSATMKMTFDGSEVLTGLGMPSHAKKQNGSWCLMP